MILENTQNNVTLKFNNNTAVKVYIKNVLYMRKLKLIHFISFLLLVK